MSIFVVKLDLGGSGPTVAIKDTIDVAGVPTRAGSRAFEDAAPAAANAAVVDRLLAAGYHLVGKANMHELAFGTTGLNAWTGTPVNPRHPAYVPGGSSSGSAAAVAAGLAEAALGTDTGGSIRIPAACCGVFGLKPTFGRVSRDGVMPAQTSLDCVGPFAGDMDALIACMRAIDPDFGALPDTAGVTVGLVEVEARPEIRRAVEAAVAAGGFAAGRVVLDAFVRAYDAGLVVINAETWAACGELVATGRVGEDVAKRLLAASRTTAADVQAAEAVRAAFTAQVDEALRTFPILALPTMADAPPLLESGADTSKLVGMTSLVRPFNLSGHPAIAIPLQGAGDFPMSLQLVAAKGRDELLCAVARQIAGRLDQH
ncbi:amidase [Thauera sinica]|uniref:Amidase n=1 Tax=Thauera sinica TaxID=2665146 RepID=A0ABW1AP76_9RHOO|nr:amidase [Thauera sp. K11]ATE62036.1 amidase [Thauera sp. K11]